MWLREKQRGRESKKLLIAVGKSTLNGDCQFTFDLFQMAKKTEDEKEEIIFAKFREALTVASTITEEKRLA